MPGRGGGVSEGRLPDPLLSWFRRPGGRDAKVEGGSRSGQVSGGTGDLLALNASCSKLGPSSAQYRPRSLLLRASGSLRKVELGPGDEKGCLTASLLLGSTGGAAGLLPSELWQE